jgi:hypothetical protein
VFDQQIEFNSNLNFKLPVPVNFIFMTESSTSKIILYIWPGSWDLLSVDPSCLAAVLYLQYTIPGKFTVVESANPDVAPNGVSLATELSVQFLMV